MELASKYDPQAVESKWYQYWLDNKLFCSKPDGREPYTVVIHTEKVIDLILSRDASEITRLEFLNEIKDMINHNIMCYSSNYSLGQAKEGFEKEFDRENKKLILVDQMLKEEKQREKKKNKEER